MTLFHPPKGAKDGLESAAIEQMQKIRKNDEGFMRLVGHG